jgi:hypothetical protein
VTAAPDATPGIGFGRAVRVWQAVVAPVIGVAVVGQPAQMIRYPYGFLDVDRRGWAAVSVSIVGVAVFLLAPAACYLWLDRRLPHRRV